jgi:hypothetical protein
MINIFSAGKERFIKSGVHYLKERFAATGNSFPLATSVFHSFSWPSATDELEEYGNSKIKIHNHSFQEMLIGDGKDEKMLNDAVGVVRI